MSSKQLVDYAAFDYFIMGCIILNIIVLATAWYLDSDTVENAMGIINNIFTGIFTIEAVLKIIAYDKLYFKNGWNVLDFFVLIGTYVQIIVSSVIAKNVGA